MTTKIIAPLRIGLFGGGADKDSKGKVINLAINLYQTVSESNTNFTPLWDNKKFIKHFTNKNITHKCDVPIESGLGSSGALAVLLTKLEKPHFSNFKLAKEAYKKELEFHPTGWQDHYAAVFGGLSSYEEDYVVTYPSDTANWLASHILLFYIGKTKKYSIEIKSINSEIVKACKAIENMNLIEIASLLAKGWEKKRKLINNKKIDNIYKRAIQSGALAGKLCGAGGGFMFFIVQLNKKAKVIKELSDCKRYDFKVDFIGIQ